MAGAPASRAIAGSALSLAHARARLAALADPLSVPLALEPRLAGEAGARTPLRAVLRRAGQGGVVFGCVGAKRRELVFQGDPIRGARKGRGLCALSDPRCGETSRAGRIDGLARQVSHFAVATGGGGPARRRAIRARARPRRGSRHRRNRIQTELPPVFRTGFLARRPGLSVHHPDGCRVIHAPRPMASGCLEIQHHRWTVSSVEQVMNPASHREPIDGGDALATFRHEVSKDH